MSHDQTTAHEIAFLNSLGTHAPQYATGMTRRELLASYVGSLHLRRNWGHISPDIVKAHALRLLKEMEVAPA